MAARETAGRYGSLNESQKQFQSGKWKLKMCLLFCLLFMVKFIQSLNLFTPVMLSWHKNDVAHFIKYYDIIV